MDVIESIYSEPEKWQLGDYTFGHEGGTKIWIANGRSFCRLYPSGAWGWRKKRAFWRAFTWWCENKPVSTAIGGA